MATERHGHIAELQSLRGLAALAVAVGHSLAIYAEPHWLERGAIVFNGRGAVSLFFVLSGFVLTKSLRTSDLAPAVWVRFWLRRGFRIYPAVWAASALSLAYVLLLHRSEPIPAGMSAYYYHLFRLDRLDVLHVAAAFGGALAYLIPTLWSIFVELVASIFMPALAYAAWRRQRIFYVAAAASVLAAFVIGTRTYYSVGLYGMDFFIGGWLAVAGPRIKAFIGGFSRQSTALVIAMGVALLFTQFLPTVYNSPVAALAEAALAAGVIGLIVFAEADLPLLRSPALVWLGDISYSFYLLHYLIACVMVRVIQSVEIATLTDLPRVAQAVVLAITSVALAIAAAALSYRFVELPGIVLGKKLESRLLGPAPRTPSAAVASPNA